MFGRRKVTDGLTETRLSKLEERAARMESALRTLELEQQAMHEQVRRWMRRAVAAESRNQEPAGAAPAAPPATPAPSPARMSSARLRAAAQGRVWGAVRALPQIVHPGLSDEAEAEAGG